MLNENNIINNSSERMLQKYFDNVPRAILEFQHLEEAIRQYLIRCEVMTASRLSGITKYKYQKSIKELQKLSLGRLVDKFERFNKNDDLLRRIRDVIEDRNFIAHQSYLMAYDDSGEPKKEDEIKALYDRTVEAKEKAEKCIFDTLKEIGELERKFVVAQKASSKKADSLLFAKEENVPICVNESILRNMDFRG